MIAFGVRTTWRRIAFNARRYWAAGMGTVPSVESPRHARQEAALETALRRLSGVESVLDVGCGSGRIAALLQRVLPDARYTGLDIDASRIERTRSVRPDGDFINCAVQDLATDRQWDLVVTSEILMHIPPAEVQAAVDRLKAVGRRHLVSAEWVPIAMEMPRRIAVHNWPHDYLTLFGPVSYAERADLQVVYVVDLDG